ncbi:MAG: hypothetical protein M3178_14440 [Pseudomonadota bacterium]|nr:hypothetical protein [Pseudomonadota bacterium]
MDAIIVGIDGSKGKLDIALLPQGETFTARRDAKGLASLIARIKPLLPQAVAVKGGRIRDHRRREPCGGRSAGRRRQSGARSRLC